MYTCKLYLDLFIRKNKTIRVFPHLEFVLHLVAIA